jgi:signal transduction histidine kinase
MKRAAEERQLLLARERAARADAEAANRAKDQFLAAVSHDLRSPLSAIAIWTRFIHRETRDGPEARAVEKIDANVKVLGRLIDDLLDVSRISTGKLRFDMAPVALPAIVESALDGVRAAAEAKRIAIRFDVDGMVPPVVADPGRRLQVVTNLVENAIKFTPDLGTVLVRLERDGDRARLTVRDTGRGIAQEFLPHIFESFSQAPGAPRQGLGLGLAIVRYIVEHHAGTVRAESAGADRGTTFTVEVPLASVAAAAAAN